MENENEILKKIDEQDKKLFQIYASVEKMRKYFMWTFIITITTIILPIVAMIFMLPWIMSTFTAAYGF